MKLIDNGLVLASGAVEPGEARAGALVVVAETPTRAVATSFVTVSIEGILASFVTVSIGPSLINNNKIHHVHHIIIL